MEETRAITRLGGRRSMRYSDGSGETIVCVDCARGLAARLNRSLGGSEFPSGYIVKEVAECGAGFVSFCEELAPTLVVVEGGRFSELPLEELREFVNRGDIRILVLTEAPSNVLCESLLRKGCSGVLCSDSDDRTLRKAVQAVFAGELWAPRRVLSSFAKETLSRDRSRELTQREADIHKLICLGLTNQQIADQLFISRETVRWHVRSLYAKLGVPSQRRAMLERGEYRSPADARGATQMSEAALS
jgi:DNA-binding NarL/FixJ family response regulator